MSCDKPRIAISASLRAATSDVSNPGEISQLSEQAVREWQRHVEAVMRGLAHAVNNRAAALSAVLELSSEPDDDPATTRSILSSELSRVRELADVIRIMGPPRGGVEAFSPEDAANQ